MTKDKKSGSGLVFFGLIIGILFFTSGWKDTKPRSAYREQGMLTNNGINSNTQVRKITDDEYYWLTMLVCCEAPHEPKDGQIAVVATVLNRFDAGYGGCTCIADVVFAPYQYSCIWDNNFHLGSQTVSYSQLQDMGIDVKSAESAVDAALRGEDPTKEKLGGGALYYYNPDVTCDEECASRASISNTYRIGNHVFYRVWD